MDHGFSSCTTAHSGRRLPDEAGAFAVFLDVDGTLLDIAQTPGSVVVPSGLPDALARLAHRLDGAVALVTGRSIDTVDRLFPGVPVVVNGLHGAQWRDGTGQIHGVPVTAEFAAAKQQLCERTQQWPGVVFEDKGAAVAAHYRRAPDREPSVRDLMDGLARAVGAGWTLQCGKSVIELRPAGRDKGDALMQTMKQRAFANRWPLAVGDDLTDEAMFAAANRLGGLSVRVGGASAHSAAQCGIGSPAEVRDWIERVAR